jgi:hypothetical protein
VSYLNSLKIDIVGIVYGAVCQVGKCQFLPLAGRRSCPCFQTSSIEQCSKTNLWVLSVHVQCSCGKNCNTVQPLIIQTSWTPENTLPCMHAQKVWPIVFYGCGYMLSDELWDLYRLALAKTDWPVYFSERCWPWSGIVSRIGIINQVRNVGISVIRTFHLFGMAAISLGSG